VQRPVVIHACDRAANFTGLGDLVEQINAASRSIEQSDNSFRKRIDGLE
jgi:hypothetical protein